MKTRTRFLTAILAAATVFTITGCNPPSSGSNNNYNFSNMYSSTYSSSSYSKPQVKVTNFVGVRLDEAIEYFKEYGAGPDTIEYCEWVSNKGKAIVDRKNWVIIEQSVRGDTIYFTCTQIVDYGKILDTLL